MKWTMRHTTFLMGLILALGLASFVALARPAVAEPAGVTPLPPVEETDGRAGACYSFYYDPPEGPTRPFVHKAQDAGSRWDRFDFNWHNLETSDGVWDPGVRDGYDTLVNDLHAAKMNMVGILLWTPDWAATGGVTGLPHPSFDQRPSDWHAPVPHDPMSPLVASAASSPPQGLYLPWDDPNNYWGRFVYKVVDRYDNKIKHWEMWNEPEWPYFWTGTSTDYAQLLKVGYQATKAACPDCTVLFGGLHYWMNTNYYKWVLNTLNQYSDAPDNNYFFDVMSVHLYSRSSSIYNEVENIRSGMTTYNVGDHPIWLTETGVPVWGDDAVAPKAKYDYAATQGEAAAYVIQSYANGWASEIERYFFFRTNDADMGEYFGLLRNDHTLRPAYVAYQVATTYLISPTSVTRTSTDSHMRVTLWGTPHGKVSTLWNESPTAGVYTLTAALPTATRVNRWGITETIAATGGVYTLTLPGATASTVSNPNDYIIGGDPLLVVESETVNEPPTSTVRSMPAVTCSPTFTVTWEGHDNESGVWFYDVQMRDGAGEWADWQSSTTVTSSQYTGEHGHTYYFRSRATDHVGNHADWPESSQVSTTLDLSSTFHLSIEALFADENRNGVWDPISTTDEITLTEVALSFRDKAGQDVVTPTIGDSWEFTTTVYAGQTYHLWAESADNVRALWFTWSRGGEVYTATYSALGLWPVTRSYLPLVLR